MARSVLLLGLCLWLSALAPALCLGGDLVHPCEDSVCSHEDGCDSDPCDPQLLRDEAPLALPQPPQPAVLPEPLPRAAVVPSASVAVFTPPPGVLPLLS